LASPDFSFSAFQRLICPPRSQHPDEVLDGRSLDGRLVQGAKTGLVVDGLDGLAKTGGDVAEADLEGIQDSLLTRHNYAFLAAFLAALLHQHFRGAHKLFLTFIRYCRRNYLVDLGVLQL
jgi:hypothetical protein